MCVRTYTIKVLAHLPTSYQSFKSLKLNIFIKYAFHCVFEKGHTMNNQTKSLRILAIFLILLESCMIGYAYFIPLSYMGIGVALIYLLLAISDLVAGKNKYLTYFLIFVSVTISIPRAILQISDIVETGRNLERAYLHTEIPKPIKRTIDVTILDCSRIPYWQGDRQIECSKDNQRQIESKNKYEVEYEEKLDAYFSNLKQREFEIQNSFLRYINLKNISHVLLILLVTPILPLAVILLIHEDFSMFSKKEDFLVEFPKSRKRSGKRKNKEDRKQKAKTLLSAGIKVSDIQHELGLSRATLYRYRKELSV